MLDILINLGFTLFGFSLNILYNIIKKKYSRKRDLFENLKKLQFLLSELDIVVQNQIYKRVNLTKSIRKNHRDIIPKGLTENQIYVEVYSKFNNKEIDLHSLIRGTTKFSKYRINNELQKWINSNYDIKLKKLDAELKKEFLDKIKSLREHLNDWFDKYHSIFINDERQALCFLGDEQKHGKKFPTKIEDTVSKVIFELEH